MTYPAHIPSPTETWPRPPSCIVASRLGEPPNGARVTVAGLVIVRQRPGTASGTVFVTLEDETGFANVIIWKKLFVRFRREVIASRLMRVTGRLQRAEGVINVIAERIEDISGMLDLLADPDARGFPPIATRPPPSRTPEPTDRTKNTGEQHPQVGEIPAQA